MYVLPVFIIDLLTSLPQSTCQPDVLRSLKAAAVHRVMITVEDPNEIQRRAASAAGTMPAGVGSEVVTESYGEGIVLQGPEGILIYLSTASSDQAQAQMLLNSIVSPAKGGAVPTPDTDSTPAKERTRSRSNDIPKSMSTPSSTSSVPRPVFSTLSCKIMNFDDFMRCPPNLRTPMPFETDIFKGVTLLMVRTNPIDSVYEQFFSGTKREFEVQVQGRFKRIPEGEVFVGAEAQAKMELGIITKSMCRMVLNFVGTMVNDLHYSFGDHASDKLCESPHLVAPLLRGMDKVVVSRPGEKIPAMGQPFYESPEARKKRTKSQDQFVVDLASTYSFSVNTSNLDLRAWNIGKPIFHCTL